MSFVWFGHSSVPTEPAGSITPTAPEHWVLVHWAGSVPDSLLLPAPGAQEKWPWSHLSWFPAPTGQHTQLLGNPPWMSSPGSIMQKFKLAFCRAALRSHGIYMTQILHSHFPWIIRADRHNSSKETSKSLGYRLSSRKALLIAGKKH